MDYKQTLFKKQIKLQKLEGKITTDKQDYFQYKCPNLYSQPVNCFLAMINWYNGTRTINFPENAFWTWGLGFSRFQVDFLRFQKCWYHFLYFSFKAYGIMSFLSCHLILLFLWFSLSNILSVNIPLKSNRATKKKRNYH